MDEDIIELINNNEKLQEEMKNKEELEKQIRGGVVAIDGENIEFEERSLLEDKIKICIPKSFEIMSHQDAMTKYPSERRPELIFTNRDTSVNISFNHMENRITEESLEDFKNSMIEILKNMQPSIKWLESGLEKINGKNIAFYEMMAPAFDGETYNLIYFGELEGRVLLCSFNCLEDQVESWRAVSFAMMKTLKICKEK
jgi:hypothetical protein